MSITGAYCLTFIRHSGRNSKDPKIKLLCTLLYGKWCLYWKRGAPKQSERYGGQFCYFWPQPSLPGWSRTIYIGTRTPFGCCHEQERFPSFTPNPIPLLPTPWLEKSIKMSMPKSQCINTHLFSPSGVRQCPNGWETPRKRFVCRLKGRMGNISKDKRRRENFRPMPGWSVNTYTHDT